MTRKPPIAAATCLLVVALAATLELPAQGTLTGALRRGPSDRQAALRKALDQRRHQIERRRAVLAMDKAAVETDRRAVLGLKRALRDAFTQLARAKKRAKKWICNAFNSTHNSPSECSEPNKGGRWITEPGGDAGEAEARVRDLQKALADARRRYDADLAAYDARAAGFNADARQLANEINAAGLGKRPVLLSGDPASVRDYALRIVDRAWGRNAADAADNLNSDPDLSSALVKAAAGARYVNLNDLRTIVSIESTADRDTGVNRFGYAGLFQMGKTAARDVGYRYEDLNDPSNWQTNVEAGAKYLDKNAKRLSDQGLPVTALNVYLAHQQGPHGATILLQKVQNGTAATTPANNNMLQNLPASYRSAITRLGQQVTVQNYYDYWSSTFDKVNTSVKLRRL